jgi:hypothetical protein
MEHKWQQELKQKTEEKSLFNWNYSNFVNKLCPLFCNFSNTVVCVGGDRVYKGQRKFIRIGYIGINPVSSLPPI